MDFRRSPHGPLKISSSLCCRSQCSVALGSPQQSEALNLAWCDMALGSPSRGLRGLQHTGPNTSGPWLLSMRPQHTGPGTPHPTPAPTPHPWLTSSLSLSVTANAFPTVPPASVLGSGRGFSETGWWLLPGAKGPDKPTEMATPAGHEQYSGVSQFRHAMQCLGIAVFAELQCHYDQPKNAVITISPRMAG